VTVDGVDVGGAAVAAAAAAPATGDAADAAYFSRAAFFNWKATPSLRRHHPLNRSMSIFSAASFPSANCAFPISVPFSCSTLLQSEVSISDTHEESFDGKEMWLSLGFFASFAASLWWCGD